MDGYFWAFSFMLLWAENWSIGMIQGKENKNDSTLLRYFLIFRLGS